MKLKNVMLAAGALGGGNALASFGQIREVKTAPITYAEKVMVDGNLSDWRSDAFNRVVAVAASENGLTEDGGQSSFTFPLNETASHFAFQYDAKNFYIAVKWDDPSPLCDGDSVTIFLDGEVKGKAEFIVQGGKIVSSIGTAATRVRDDKKGWMLEASVPWTDLIGTDEIPSGDVKAVVRFAWSGLDCTELDKLQHNDKITFLHTTMSVLTAEPQFRELPHLRSKEAWGELHFGKKIVGQCNETLIKDFTELGCPRAASSLKIDGTLSDWQDAVWGEFAQLGDIDGNKFVGKVATKYDSDNLYVAVKMRHPTGKPVNVMPEETGLGYRGGDAFQMRLSDGQKYTTSICAWWDSQANAPALTVDGKEHGFRLFKSVGGEIAFGSWNEGYTMEFKIPWKALLANVAGMSAPKDGDVWKATFQPWWQMGGNQFSFITALSFKGRDAFRVKYDMPRDGFLTLGVFDKKSGRILRQLMKGAFRQKGTLSEPWDGKDQYGKFVVAGEYLVKGIVTDEVKEVYQFSMGNPGNPPWPMADGSGDWLSDEAPAQGMATDGENVYIVAPGSEKGYAVMKVDGTGNKKWGVMESIYPRSSSVSYFDGKVYVLFSGPAMTTNDRHFNGKNATGRAVLVCYDAATGKKIDFSAKTPLTIISKWPYREEVTPLWEMMASKTFMPSKYIGQPRYWASDVGETCNALGLAVTKDRIAVSKFYDDLVEFYDKVTLAKTAEVKVVKPVGLYACGDGNILAVSEKKVVKIAPDNTVSDVITGGLEAPVCVTQDKKGFVYVSDWAGSMQVKKFTGKGKLVRAIGTTGGRPWLGDWDESGMLMPHGLAVTDGGMLWVAEADMCPKRISAWDAKNGKLIRDWLGPVSYGGCTGFWYDPEEDDVVHFEGNAWRIDWKTGKAKILRTERRRMSKAAQFEPQVVNPVFSVMKAFTKDGKKYVAFSSPKEVIICRRDGEKIIPCAAAGGLHRPITDDGTGVQVWDSDIMRHTYKNIRPEVFRGHAGDNYSWNDLNGDGEVQPDEITFVKTRYRGEVAKNGEQYEMYNNGGSDIDSVANIYFGGFGKSEDVINKLCVKKWGAWGPQYDIAEARVIHRQDTTEVKRQQYNSAIYLDKNDNLYVPTIVTTSMGWFAGNIKDTMFSLDAEGNERWTMAMPEGKGKDALGATAFVGEWAFKGLGTILCSWHWWWNFRPYFVTSDGFYMGTALDETKIGPNALWSESRQFYLQRKNGDAYMINSANQGLHFFKMEGFDNCERFETTMSVSAADLAKAKEMSEVKVKIAAPKPEISVRAFDEGAVTIDGALAEWRNVPWVKIGGGKGRAAKMALGKCGDKLLLAADVDDSTPMKQVGSDYRSLFITGDVVDMMLGTDKSAVVNRKEATYGDIRVSISEMNGKPVVVVSEPKVNGFKGDGETLMAAKLDRIRLLDNAEVRIVRRKSGYVVEAAIPLKELGIEANETGTLRGDLGVVFSDAIGGRELRLYYYNKKTEMVADLTTEATLQPREWGAVHFPMGINLAKDGHFEGGLKDNPKDGWKCDFKVNGATIKSDKNVSFSGEKSILIQQSVPVIFTDEAMSDPDYEVFRRSANGGKGSGHASLRHDFEVEGGKTYLARIRYRAEGLKQEFRQRGSHRGYATASMYVVFIDRSGKNLGRTTLAHFSEDTHEWVEMTSANEWNVSGEIKVPLGAIKAIVNLKFSCLAPNRKPKLWLGAFEFVEK